MKFKYNIPRKTFRMYGEANYVFAHQKEYLKDENKNIRNFYFAPIMVSIILFILNITLEFINNPASEAVNVIFVLSIIYNFIIIVGYFNYKNNLKEGVLQVSKKGITDISDIVVTFPWDSVKLIGVTKNMMVIISDSTTIMFLVEPNEELIEEILKFKDVKVIRNK